MEYDCSRCHDIQRSSCCKKCSDLQRMVAQGTLLVNDARIHAVVCSHCDQDNLRNMVSKHEVACSHNEADGTFTCSLSEHCELGMQRIDTQNLSFECIVTPCDTCS